MLFLSLDSRRFAALTATFVVAALALPSVMFGSDGIIGTSAGESVDADRRFTIGVTDFMVNTLNPIGFSTIYEAMAVYPCYSALLQYDDEMNLDGDLARSWSVDGQTWRFELVDTAYFVDPADPTNTSHPVTAADVLFTYSTMRNVSGVHTYGPVLPGVAFDISSTGPYEVSIELSEPYAPFVSSLLSIPILPEYIWEGVEVSTFSNDPPIGSGPFYYATDGLPFLGEVVLERNPIWYMEEERGWKPRTDSWILKDLITGENAFAALASGTIDFMINVPRDSFLQEIPLCPDLVGYGHDGGFVYEFNLNQMTDEMRDELGAPFTYGENNQLLQDPTIKMAMAMCVDKEAFVTDVLDDCGMPADSLVPSSSPWHYTYGEAPGEELIPFDTDGARAMLMAAGWTYDEWGAPATSETVPLCKAGGSDPLSFRFDTLDNEAEWETAAMLIRGWCEEAGIELNVQIRSASEMNSIWFAADYDTWLWDWIFDPLNDPSDILSVMTTDAIGSWSDCFWSNATYDALYNESLVNLYARGEIIGEMQAMLYEDAACQCVAYRYDLYGASLEDWQNYGDLSANHMLLPDVTPTWLSLRMYPTDNWAPVVEVDPLFECDSGIPISVEAAIWDDDISTDLEYRWFWGDGTSTDWIPGDSGTSSHLYARDGWYTAYVAAREASPSNGYEDYFMTSNKTMIIIGGGNAAPVIQTDLQNRTAVEGEVLTFYCQAIDFDGEELIYTWDFGDDSGLFVGNPMDHAYAVAGEYEYTVWVDDLSGLVGHNVSDSAFVIVEEVPATFTLELVAGWNLISIPLVDHDYMASTLGLSFGDMVSRWDSEDQVYDKNYIVGISGPASDFAIEPSWAYWIFSGSEQSIVLSGHEPTEPQSRLITVPPGGGSSGGGWVQVGLASFRTDLWASDLADMYIDGMLFLVSRWNADTQTYSSYIVGPDIGDFQLDPGDGLWLYVEGSGELSYDP